MTISDEFSFDFVIGSTMSKYPHSAVLNPDQWYTLALSYNVTTNILTLYVDGAAQSYGSVEDFSVDGYQASQSSGLLNP